MKARLCRHDMDLLLLVHGELPALQSLWTKIHLARCPSCQARLAEFTSVSRLAAAALRPGSAAISISHPFNPRRLSLILALGVLLILTVAAASYVRFIRPTAAKAVDTPHFRLDPANVQSCAVPPTVKAPTPSAHK